MISIRLMLSSFVQNCTLLLQLNVDTWCIFFTIKKELFSEMIISMKQKNLPYLARLPEMHCKCNVCVLYYLRFHDVTTECAYGIQTMSLSMRLPCLFRSCIMHLPTDASHCIGFEQYYIIAQSFVHGVCVYSCFLFCR